MERTNYAILEAYWSVLENERLSPLRYNKIDVGYILPMKPNDLSVALLEPNVLTPWNYIPKILISTSG